MTIITLQQRFNSSQVGQNTLKEIQQIQKKHNSSFNWARRKQLTHNCMIPLQNILIDDKTQRTPFETPRIRKLINIAKNPCPFHFKRAILSQRLNGQLVVAEGQARCLVAYAIGTSRVPCDIYQFNSVADEVAFFTKQNANVHSVTGWNKHHVIVFNSKDPKHNQAKDIETIVTNCGLYYDPSQPMGIDATSSYTGIKDCMTRFEPTSNKNNGIPVAKAGQRACIETIAITNLMIKYGGGQKLKGDLFYPFSEFVYQRGGKRCNFARAIQELDTHLSNLQTKLANKPIPETININAIFQQIGLSGKSNKMRASVWKQIRKW